MDLKDIISPQAQTFIRENFNTPVNELLLKYRKNDVLNIPVLIAQIEGRNKAKSKLPTWYKNENIIYPVKISVEQSSSEITAQYKASLVSGELLIDMTGGFGVDDVFFAEKIKRVLHIEQNEELSEIALHNFSVLKKKNIETIVGNSESIVLNYPNNIDGIYLDPARRKEGNKVFLLSDCEPDIVKLKNSLFEKTTFILLKTSPLLDIKSALKELQFVKEIHVVAVDNECKELLFILDKNTSTENPEIIAVNFRKGLLKQEFKFKHLDEHTASVEIGEVASYLAEPNTAVLKAGAFKSIAKKFNLKKLHPSSHLYTSNILPENFPGRIFKVIKTIKYSKKEILDALPEGKANITVRNFPDSVEIIRKKTGIKDGGNNYIFATTNSIGKPILLLTEKII